MEQPRVVVVVHKTAEAAQEALILLPRKARSDPVAVSTPGASRTFSTTRPSLGSRAAEVGLDGRDDVLVAGAPAEDARELLADRLPVERDAAGGES